MESLERFLSNLSINDEGSVFDTSEIEELVLNLDLNPNVKDKLIESEKKDKYESCKDNFKENHFRNDETLLPVVSKNDVLKLIHVQNRIYKFLKINKINFTVTHFDNYTVFFGRNLLINNNKNFIKRFKIIINFDENTFSYKFVNNDFKYKKINGKIKKIRTLKRNKLSRQELNKMLLYIS